MSYTTKCAGCNKFYTLELTNEQDRKLFDYLYGKELIQNVFPELNPTEREFIISHYCPECQSTIFLHAESDKIREEKFND